MQRIIHIKKDDRCQAFPNLLEKIPFHTIINISLKIHLLENK